MTPCPLFPADCTEPVHSLNTSEFPVVMTPGLYLFFRRMFTERLHVPVTLWRWTRSVDKIQAPPAQVFLLPLAFSSTIQSRKDGIGWELRGPVTLRRPRTLCVTSRLPVHFHGRAADSGSVSHLPFLKGPWPQRQAPGTPSSLALRVITTNAVKNRGSKSHLKKEVRRAVSLGCGDAES